MKTIDPTLFANTQLSKPQEQLIINFFDTLLKLPAVSIKSFCLYGSALRKEFRPGQSDVNLLILLDSIDLQVLTELKQPTHDGRLKRLSPFYLTTHDLASSADVFPVKFLAIKSEYLLLSGQDALINLDICPNNLRLRCEQTVKNTLLRMRRQYLTQGSHLLMDHMIGSLVELKEIIRMSLFRKREKMPHLDDVFELSRKEFKLDPTVLETMKSIQRKKRRIKQKEVEGLFSQYLLFLSQLANVVDAM